MKFERKEIDRTFADSAIVNVAFEKKDKSIRTMKCTRKPELMPEASRPKEDILQGGNINDDVYKVFDLEAMGWRCFTVAKLQDMVGEDEEKCSSCGFVPEKGDKLEMDPKRDDLLCDECFDGRYPAWGPNPWG